MTVTFSIGEKLTRIITIIFLFQFFSFQVQAQMRKVFLDEFDEDNSIFKLLLSD